MKNFNNILLHEVKHQLSSFKFILLLVISCLVTIVCVVTQVQDFKERQVSYIEEIKKAEEIKKTFKVYSEFQIPILIAPNPLSIFIKGVDEAAGNKSVISITDLPTLKTTSQNSNPFLAIFSNLDIVGIVRLILSIAIILMVADAVSGERENQTLKIVFSNSVGKFEYIVAKYLGSLITAILPVALIFILTSLIMVSQPYISMNSDFFIRISFLFLTCILSVSIFVLLGLIVSACASSAAQSVIIGLFIWLTITIIYPSTLNFINNFASTFPSKNKLDSETKKLKDEFLTKDFDWTMANYHRKQTDYLLRAEPLNIYPLSFFKYIGATQKYEFQFQENHVKLMLPQFLDLSKKIASNEDKYRNEYNKPEKRSIWFSFFLPDFLLGKTCEKLANVDKYSREIELNHQLSNYRETVLNYLKNKKDAFGLLFFTRFNTEDMNDDISKYSQQLLNKYEYNNIVALNTSDVPVFKYNRHISFPFELGIIILLNILLLYLAINLFIKSSY